MRSTSFLTLILVAQTVVASTSYARTNQDSDASAIVSHAIAYQDLDLTTPRGVATLQRRASLAVDTICANAVGPAVGGTDYRFAMMKCEQHVRGQIRPRVKSLLAAAPERRARTLAGGRSSAPSMAAR